MCGEQAITATPDPCTNGSSPRVRGTGTAHDLCSNSHRFIPACAGNRSTGHATASLAAVHPRVCGEQPRSPRPKQTRRGSSPRVRGTVTRAPSAALGLRFIPACAGNSFSRFIPACAGNRSGALRQLAPTVHPRVCGEQLPVRSASLNWRRFIPACAGNMVPFKNLSRFIPACAGNPHGLSVHPRVCGEQVSYSSCGKADSIGSSPRVRGTVLEGFGEPPARRFIPACAGNSPWPFSEPPAQPVHPRVCGEQSVAR